MIALVKFFKSDVFKAFSTGFLVGAALLGVAAGTSARAQDLPAAGTVARI